MLKIVANYLLQGVKNVRPEHSCKLLFVGCEECQTNVEHNRKLLFAGCKDCQTNVKHNCKLPVAGCEECQVAYADQCPTHRLNIVVDKVVLSRAWASLPVMLSIFRLGTNTEDNASIGGNIIFVCVCGWVCVCLFVCVCMHVFTCLRVGVDERASCVFILIFVFLLLLLLF